MAVSATTPDLFRHESGAGEPLVLVHGSWSEHATWQLTVPDLADSMRVITYDRLGHGQSPPAPEGPLARRRHEDDLAALIETVAGGRAHVVGTSYGGSIALGLAARRPELFRSVSAHEPPLVAIAAHDELVEEAARELERVRRIVQKGDPEAGARHFVENLAIGPGAWPLLPPEIHEAMIRNAPAFAAELLDPDWAGIDLAALRELLPPVLLTRGDASLSWPGPIIGTLAAAIPGRELVTIEGAGHVPHQTHPAEWAGVVASFCRWVSG